MRYQSIHEVPARWRKLRGAPLSLGQIELILDRAEASEKPFGLALAEAKREFAALHEIRGGQWVKIEEAN